jgi:hypothetical protein
MAPKVGGRSRTEFLRTILCMVCLGVGRYRTETESSGIRESVCCSKIGFLTKSDRSHGPTVLLLHQHCHSQESMKGHANKAKSVL